MDLNGKPAIIGALVLSALLLAAAWFFLVPSCGPNEVLARGIFGFVCLEGHR